MTGTLAEMSSLQRDPVDSVTKLTDIATGAVDWKVTKELAQCRWRSHACYRFWPLCCCSVREGRCRRWPTRRNTSTTICSKRVGRGTWWVDSVCRCHKWRQVRLVCLNWRGVGSGELRTPLCCVQPSDRTPAGVASAYQRLDPLIGGMPR